MESFVIIAHRGYSSARPENTIDAFDHALSSGFTHFETDCQLTKDNMCIVLHDEKLGRTNNGVGVAWEQESNALLQLDAGSWFSEEYKSARIPTLQGVLEAYHDRAHIHLELKSTQTDLPAVAVQILQDTGWLDVASACGPFSVPGLTVTSFHLHQLQAIKQLCPCMRCAWLVHEMPSSVLQTALEARLDGLCPRANIISKDEVAAATAAGLTVRAWGIKTEQLLQDAWLAGAHGATVNWPGRARELLQAWQQQQQQHQRQDEAAESS